MRRIHALVATLTYAMGLVIFPIPTALGAGLQASDGKKADRLGFAVSISGKNGFAGAYAADSVWINSGSAYLFRELDYTAVNVTEDVKLTASDKKDNLSFGNALSLSGTIGLVGAFTDNVSGLNSGSAYLFRNLDTGSGNVTEKAKLRASDSNYNDQFGYSVDISGTLGLVGIPYNDVVALDSGAAYLFRNLDTASGNVTEVAKLTASDGEIGDTLGLRLSVSGTAGLVGSGHTNTSLNSDGAAYLFRRLDTVVGTVTEDAKLVASDGAMSDGFCASLDFSGDKALVGAHQGDDNGYQSGSAYFFRGLNTVMGLVTENVKLKASDGASYDNFGISGCFSGDVGLVGAYLATGNTFRTGAAYLFRGLDTAQGSMTESVKLRGSGGLTGDWFGYSVAMDGDRFLIGEPQISRSISAPGRVYSGTVSSLTELDTGNASHVIAKISFVSREDWVVGRTTDGNSVTLSSGDTADVRGSGKTVFIGKEPGSDDNRLEIVGTLLARSVAIGAQTGTAGNMLVLRSSANLTGVTRMVIGDGSKLIIEGDHTAAGALLTKLLETTLRVWDGAALQTVTNGNQGSLLTASFSGGFTTFETSSAGYSAWADINAPTGEADDDFDGDGVDNAVEYVLGGTKDSNDIGKFPQVSDSGGHFTFTFERRQNSTDATLQIEVGTNLVTWPLTYTVLAKTESQQAGVTVEETPANPGFDTVTLKVAKAPDTAKFARIKVAP